MRKHYKKNNRRGLMGITGENIVKGCGVVGCVMGGGVALNLQNGVDANATAKVNEALEKGTKDVDIQLGSGETVINGTQPQMFEHNVADAGEFTIDETGVTANSGG